MKNMIPVVMAGVLGIYGLIVSVIISQKVSFGDYDKYVGYAHLAPSLRIMTSTSVFLCISGSKTFLNIVP